MYDGKRIALGDVIYSSPARTSGGAGLIARGIVTSAGAAPRRRAWRADAMRQHHGQREPPSSNAASAARTQALANWDDGKPETELNFKFYRQATNKIVGLSARRRISLGDCF